MARKDASHFMSYVLRHKPEAIGLEMDTQGWVSVDALLRGMNEVNNWALDKAQLEKIVAEDTKGRYKFNDDHTRIKACQGHSIPWVEPMLVVQTPPDKLYHGTTKEAYEQILESDVISKMKRHAVHLQADERKAWQSAERWHQTPIVLAIDALRMHRDGFSFGVTENNVWCASEVPVSYICTVLTK